MSSSHIYKTPLNLGLPYPGTTKVWTCSSGFGKIPATSPGLMLTTPHDTTSHHTTSHHTTSHHITPHHTTQHHTTPTHTTNTGPGDQIHVQNLNLQVKHVKQPCLFWLSQVISHIRELLSGPSPSSLTHF